MLLYDLLKPFTGGLQRIISCIFKDKDAGENSYVNGMLTGKSYPQYEFSINVNYIFHEMRDLGNLF